MESYIPDIIDGLVNSKLDPGAVCQAIGLCEAGETTQPSEHTTTWWDGGQILSCIPRLQSLSISIRYKCTIAILYRL